MVGPSTLGSHRLTMNSLPVRVFYSLLALLLPGLAPLSGGASESAAVRRLLADPPREYATAPLWVWNDLLTEAQIRETLRDLAGQKVLQVMVHPRPGLMTPYLGEDWFRLWRVALDEAAKLDMNVWIYDENSYPSGFAGGWVPELMPSSRGRGLVLKESKTVPAWSGAVVGVYRLEGEEAEPVTARVRAGAAMPEGRYLVASEVRSGNSPWHGNRSYVNLLTPGVTETFLDVTLGAYEREIGAHLGKRVPGVFTDEPNIRPAGGFPWCEDLPEQFERRWGYSLLDHLPSLSHPVGDWRKVRFHYFSTISELFIERWAKPFYERCERLGLESTGHYWDHEWPHCAGVPDNMAMAAWQHRPGVDTLMNQYAEHTHAQFGNVRYVREVASVANQLGRGRTLVEIYGAGGWDLRFEDMKRIGDWLLVLGVNTMNEHLSYVTLRGARKRDHPQSFSYHEPWWEAYHVSARYLTRLCAVLSQGQQVNRVLVIEPTTTAWMYQGEEARLREVGDGFFKLLMALEGAQVEYDLGCEDVMNRAGALEGKELRVGERRYRTVVIPPGTENLTGRTWEMLQGLVAAGGDVLACGAPARRDGVLPAGGDAAAAWGSRLALYRPDELVRALEEPSRQPAGFRLVRAAGDRGILFHHRRQLADGQVLFLVNTSIEAASAGVVESELGGVERWDPATGKAEAYAFERVGEGVRARFELPPSGSLLLFLSAARRPAVEVVRVEAVGVAGEGGTEIERLAPNVLTLDYVDVAVGGETRSNEYYYAANQRVWRRHGMERNPWDSAVQFKDELITRTFGAESGFTATYRFTVVGAVPKDLAVVIERADLYAVACNGRALTVRPGDWWLDKAFSGLGAAGVARVGENEVRIEARPFTMHHELEPAYLLGDFSLVPGERGFVVGPPQPLRMATAEGEPAVGNHPDGTMWLSGGVGFGAGVEDRQPWVEFDLGREVTLSGVRIWNYNEGHVRDLTGRGAARVRVRGATRAGGWDGGAEGVAELGTFALRRGNARALTAETLAVSSSGPVRWVRLDLLKNWHGVSFPCGDAVSDHGFVGLGKVRFVDAEGRGIEGVTVRGCSSELASHQRVAAHLVDGRGLVRQAGLGWNDQGLPFYAEGVAYRQRFRVERAGERHVVALPQWYGSVARVTVNGALAGYITAPPWECDVTGQIRAGDNRVEVVVVGTLKNTLGPHHGGHALGSAWPSMFQQGPPEGPPPGSSYSTVGYGLFAPFELRRLVVGGAP